MAKEAAAYSPEPTCCSSPDVKAIPANLFTSGMFQTGVFGGFWDFHSFVVFVPTCWAEMVRWLVSNSQYAQT